MEHTACWLLSLNSCRFRLCFVKYQHVCLVCRLYCILNFWSKWNFFPEYTHHKPLVLIFETNTNYPSKGIPMNYVHKRKFWAKSVHFSVISEFACGTSACKLASLTNGKPSGEAAILTVSHHPIYITLLSWMRSKAVKASLFSSILLWRWMLKLNINWSCRID